MPKKTPNKYYDVITNKVTKTAEMLIYGVIGDSWFEESTTARQFVIDFRNLEKDHDRINVRLNSPGGSVFDGLAIGNAISASKKDIHTYNDGVCASMAADLLFSVKPENVHPAKNSLLMLHSPMGGALGNRKDIEKVLNVLDKCQKVIVSSICGTTGLEEKEVEKKYFDCDDHWFTASEALEEGLYGSIEDFEAENIPQNITGMKLVDLVKVFEPTNSIFSDWKASITPKKQPDNSTIIDMDIKLLRDAYGLSEKDYPTDEAVLAFIKEREQKFTDLEAAKTKADEDLVTANNTITEKDAEIKDLLEKVPGATSAQATTEKNANNGGGKEEDEPSADFATALTGCMNILNPKQ